jgi:glutamate dehydrogenase (NAD(P)+)
MPANINPFQTAQRQLDEAAELLGLSPALHAFLREPMQEVAFTIPLQMDDGSHEVFKGFRIQYNTARGPARGRDPLSRR